jgi:two-component system nitrogen regulation sensor histidine kinase NtrY
VLEEYGEVKVVIIDNGKGIPEDELEKVFVPNFTTKSSGTGLGLAISKANYRYE